MRTRKADSDEREAYGSRFLLMHPSARKGSQNFVCRIPHESPRATSENAREPSIRHDSRHHMWLRWVDMRRRGCAGSPIPATRTRPPQRPGPPPQPGGRVPRLRLPGNPPRGGCEAGTRPHRARSASGHRRPYGRRCLPLATRASLGCEDEARQVGPRRRQGAGWRRSGGPRPTWTGPFVSGSPAGGGRARVSGPSGVTGPSRGARGPCRCPGSADRRWRTC